MPLDKSSLALLLVREHDKLAAYTWSLVRDDHLVDDVLQEMALVATRRSDEINDETHFLGWMRITCRQIALDLLRHRQRRPHPLGDAVLNLLDRSWAEHDATSSADLTEALRLCLSKLTPYSQQLVEMRYRQGLKSSRIAARLNRNVTSVYIALTRVHRSLADCIRGHLASEQTHG